MSAPHDHDPDDTRRQRTHPRAAALPDPPQPHGPASPPGRPSTSGPPSAGPSPAGTRPHGPAADAPAPDGSTPDGSAPDGSAPHGSAHGQVPHGPLPCGRAAGGPPPDTVETGAGDACRDAGTPDAPGTTARETGPPTPAAPAGRADGRHGDEPQSADRGSERDDDRPGDPSGHAAPSGSSEHPWDDGLIARRARPEAPAGHETETALPHQPVTDVPQPPTGILRQVRDSREAGRVEGVVGIGVDREAGGADRAGTVRESGGDGGADRAGGVRAVREAGETGSAQDIAAVAGSAQARGPAQRLDSARVTSSSQATSSAQADNSAQTTGSVRADGSPPAPGRPHVSGTPRTPGTPQAIGVPPAPGAPTGRPAEAYGPGTSGAARATDAGTVRPGTGSGSVSGQGADLTSGPSGTTPSAEARNTAEQTAGPATATSRYAAAEPPPAPGHHAEAVTARDAAPVMERTGVPGADDSQGTVDACGRAEGHGDSLAGGGRSGERATAGPYAQPGVTDGTGVPEIDAAPPLPPRAAAQEEELRQRLGALRELIGLSRTRLDTRVLGEAGRVLDSAAARRALSRSCTTVALAGATGSGKSTLFNALAGTQLSEAGVRRPTTALPVACTWGAEAGRASGRLLDRLGVPGHARHHAPDPESADLDGLVLIDLPDHDSVATEHRETADRILEKVDAVVWVVDPEKYADAVLHERYLRRLAGHAEVTFVVLNQTDRLARDAVDAVLDDLRRLLDEDGMALGEHGEPGAVVLAASALTGDGLGFLREELGTFVAARHAAVLRLGADLDGAMERLRPVYSDPAPGTSGSPAGLTEEARGDFEHHLAVAVGAAAAGQAAERAWLRQAEHLTSTPWMRLLRWYAARPGPGNVPDTARIQTAGPATLGSAALRRLLARTEPGTLTVSTPVPAGITGAPSSGTDGAAPGTRQRTTLQQSCAARPVVAQAVRELSDAAAHGLPQAWARTVRETARRGAAGLPEALDEVIASVPGEGSSPAAPDADAAPAAPTAAAAGPTATTASAGPVTPVASAAAPGAPAVAEPGAGAGTGAADGGVGTGSTSGTGSVRGVDGRDGADGVAGVTVAAGGGGRGAGIGEAGVAGAEPSPVAGAEGERAGEHGSAERKRPPRPPWLFAVLAGHGLLAALQLAGAVWLLAAVVAGARGAAFAPPLTALAAGVAGGPLLAWGSRVAARGPARAYGLEREHTLRELAAACGAERVLEPVAAELVRYREVRERYVIASGALGVPGLPLDDSLPATGALGSSASTASASSPASPSSSASTASTAGAGSLASTTVTGSTASADSTDPEPPVSAAELSTTHQ